MIAEAAPPLLAAHAARRAGQGRSPVWLCSPEDGDLGVAREVVACDPVRVVRDDVQALAEAWREEAALWKGPPALPIAVGFLGYELGRSFERVRGPVRESGWPALEFRFYDALWIRDARGAEIVARDAAAAARLRDRLAQGPTHDREDTVVLGPLEDLDPLQHYLNGVERILEYLRAGDVYQVNLARRLSASVPDDGGPPGLSLFTRLQRESPAPHALWMADEEAALVGNSPERFLRLGSDGAIETRPIKGTRPRTGDAAELARHPKDLAEHLMIVDLERNDLGRVCRPGSVKVRGFARTLSLPTVHHLVSTVAGQLRPGVDLPALLRATFPGGSITGAPKIRAMEIIAELESAARGPYTGATGWLGAAGDLDLAIAIRTALVRQRRLTLWVGGGIVIDSSPQDELRETIAKASAFARLTA